ncbi:MAG: 50S ribosomal protein L29 [Candidatus Magasanikbacteria bacterium RIFOXYD2_FULL_41_14]|uniref:Large ribosomal subunit protein uL29 n=1 Tax=Candidatus Magasanikbacteria bacterium RIFOXYD2_FULL_41_14 TaxID=1798709 RepID=A0A1F6PC02_9BACT|nr:MAG: 50S ribosomal protein L29 [Candidatus Magasanikbacteria bacterium RIFOXYD2_FULL_41_14]
MDFSELKNKSVNDVRELLAQFSSQLRELRFKALSKSLKQTHKLNALRKDIAKIKTFINQK